MAGKKNIQIKTHQPASADQAMGNQGYLALTPQQDLQNHCSFWLLFSNGHATLSREKVIRNPETQWPFFSFHLHRCEARQIVSLLFYYYHLYLGFAGNYPATQLCCKCSSQVIGFTFSVLCFLWHSLKTFKQAMAPTVPEFFLQIFKFLKIVHVYINNLKSHNCQLLVLQVRSLAQHGWALCLKHHRLQSRYQLGCFHTENLGENSLWGPFFCIFIGQFFFFNCRKISLFSCWLPTGGYT